MSQLGLLFVASFSHPVTLFRFDSAAKAIKQARECSYCCVASPSHVKVKRPTKTFLSASFQAEAN